MLPHWDRNYGCSNYRVLEDVGRDSNEVMVKATQECPKTAELFYVAARLSLSQHSEDTPTTSMETAVQWLVCCVSNFFQITTSGEIGSDLAKMLYR